MTIARHLAAGPHWITLHSRARTDFRDRVACARDYPVDSSSMKAPGRPHKRGDPGVGCSVYAQPRWTGRRAGVVASVADVESCRAPTRRTATCDPATRAAKSTRDEDPRGPASSASHARLLPRSIGLVNDIRPAGEVIERMMSDAHVILGRLGRSLSSSGDATSRSAMARPHSFTCPESSVGIAPGSSICFSPSSLPVWTRLPIVDPDPASRSIGPYGTAPG